MSNLFLSFREESLRQEFEHNERVTQTIRIQRDDVTSWQHFHAELVIVYVNPGQMYWSRSKLWIFFVMIMNG